MMPYKLSSLLSANPSEGHHLLPQGPVSFSQASTSSSIPARKHALNFSSPTTSAPPAIDLPSLLDSEFSNSISILNLTLLQGLHLMMHFTLMRHVSNIWPPPAPDLARHCPGFARIYEAIKTTNQPNYLGARIHVDSGLNINQWRLALANYHDQDLCDLLDFGWPVGYLKDSPPTTVKDNHPSANNCSAHIQDFIDKESSFNAILGPFEGQQFAPWTRLSPLMTSP